VSSPERSDLSDTVLDGDTPARLTVVLPDGSRRRLQVTTAEAEAFRERGQPDGARSWLRRAPWWTIGTWVAITVAAALIGQAIADRSSRQQVEVEIDATLVEDLSRASVALHLAAQDARRAPTAAERSELGNRAADAWVLESGGIEGRMRAYYPDSAAMEAWHDYQQAIYLWGGLAIDRLAQEAPEAVSARRAANVAEIRAYAEPCTREPPVRDPWAAMAAPPPVDAAVYQWVGLCLLGHRGDVARTIVETRPDLGPPVALLGWP
jgi:hypothetical protein